MLLIHKTISLCNECYRHIPANVYEQDGAIKMSKLCPEHGLMESIVEVDPQFYYSLQHDRDIDSFNQVLFEATDRCQLECPHCYHLPENKTTDVPLDLIISQLNTFPKDCVPMLAGAEATLRPDFVELCNSINSLGFPGFSLLSNGLRFSDIEFTQDCYNNGLKVMCLGLNHYTYQGQKIHDKQLRALQNMLDTGYNIGYVGYTIENYDHLDDILKEIKSINHKNINHYRIRCGSFIGRSSDIQRGYLSVLVKHIKDLIGSEVVSYSSDDNPYHVMLQWGDILLRVIQWPDVTNIDMEELTTGPWCQFVDGPITNFVHQVILRDALVNNNMPQLDYCPERYHYRPSGSESIHWKHDYIEPTTIEQLEYNYNDTVRPGTIKKVIGIKQ